MNVTTPLNAKQKHALDLVARELGHDGLSDAEDERQESFHILDECGGCVPEDCLGDDLSQDIRGKFASVFWAACELAIERRPGLELTLLIDPSLEDATSVAVLGSTEPKVYLRYDSKAWHFHFPDLASLANFVLEQAGKIQKAT
jgi:hypothetical protein